MAIFYEDSKKTRLQQITFINNIYLNLIIYINLMFEIQVFPAFHSNISRILQMGTSIPALVTARTNIRRSGGWGNVWLCFIPFCSWLVFVHTNLIQYTLVPPFFLKLNIAGYRGHQLQKALKKKAESRSRGEQQTHGSKSISYHPIINLEAFWVDSSHGFFAYQNLPGAQ